MVAFNLWRNDKRVLEKILQIISKGEYLMPVKVRKVKGGFRVSHGGKVSAKHTTKSKAKRQSNLLRGIAHGWKPTRKK
jgi:DNA-binding NarL/FixJ family response regulator